MDPVTHAVIGMAAAKITGNGLSLSSPQTAGIIIGSVFPDIDILLQKWGDYVYLKNHRGATHSILGLIVSSVLITAVLAGFYHNANLLNVFLWSLVGCCSHTFFDIFNSYGAKLLWPFYNKKSSLSLLIIFDPVFMGSLLGYIFVRGSIQYMYLGIFLFYLVSRVLTRLYIKFDLKKKFGDIYKKISILPSMTGLFRWHFILEAHDCCVVGEKNIIKRSIKIREKLYKLQDEVLESILFSHPGRFFSEFTPLFHVACEKVGDIKIYVFTDLRYYMRNEFLHHAVVEMDENNYIIKASFNPYSMQRSSLIPMHDRKSSNSLPL